MASTIKPQVGRRCWFWQGADTGFSVGDPLQPFDAGIIFVVDEAAGIVNLDVIDHLGNQATVMGATLSDPTGDELHNGEVEHGYATWMPYQVEQEKKAQARAAEEAAKKAPAPPAKP